MCFFFSLAPATFWLTVGYFVLFAAARAETGVQTVGRILAIWIFFIAVFIMAAGAYVSLSDACPIEHMMEKFARPGAVSS